MKQFGRIFLGPIIFGLIVTCAHATISCPPMPEAVTSVNKDIKSEISASVGSFGKIKAGDISVKTEIQANNLFAKYPNVDKLLALQTMSATYCEILIKSTVSETEKLNRWERFQDKVLDLKAGSNQSSHTAAGANRSASAVSRPVNPKDFPLLSGMRVGVMYIERNRKSMMEIKDRLTKVGAIVTTNEVSDWRGYPEYVGRLLYNPAKLELATQLKKLIYDLSFTKLYETREISEKYDLIIWVDPAK